MGWTHVPGREVGTLDTDAPLPAGTLGAALGRVNARAADGEPWMDDRDVRGAIAELTAVPLGKGVVQANLDTTDLLLNGCVLPAPSAAHGGPSA